MTSWYFTIVGTRDNPLFEAELGTVKANAVVDPKKEEYRHLNQFVIHAALDMVDDAMWTSKEMYLKVVDRFNGWLVSAYVTATGTRLMLLHDKAEETGIKNFFFEVHELFIKTLLNPLYDVNSPITSPVFDAKVRALAKKHINVS